jgi:hypothetical protein
MQPKAPDELSLKQKIKIVGALVVVAAPMFGLALIPVYHQGAHIEKPKVEPAKTARSHAAKVGKIKSKRKTKMEKIAIGQTKTLNVTPLTMGSIGIADTDSYSLTGATFAKNGTASALGIKATWPTFYLSTNPGSVPVAIEIPVDVSLVGTYTLGIAAEDDGSAGETGPFDGYVGSVEFEVVCIEKVTITATPTF